MADGGPRLERGGARGLIRTIAATGALLRSGEPLFAIDKLTIRDGIIVYRTPDAVERFEIVLGNSRRFLAGQPLRNVVDKANWF